MSTMIQRQVLVTMPNVDWDFFTTLADKFKWVTVSATPIQSQLTDEELYRLAEEIKAETNPHAPKISMKEIVKEVRDYRNGK